MKRSGIQLPHTHEKSILNVYSILLNLVFEEIDKYKDEFERRENSVAYLEMIETIGQSRKNLLAPDRVWNDVKRVVLKMHQDPGLQRALFENRATLPFLESIKYYSKKENVERLLKDDVEMNFDDFFYAAIKTTGQPSFKYIKNPKKAIMDTGTYLIADLLN